MATNPPPTPPTEAEILAFLSDRPDKLGALLASQPAFLELCLATAVNTGLGARDGNIVNLAPALAARARAEARRLSLKNRSLLTVAAENMLSWTRLHHATLALLASLDLAGMRQVIETEFPAIFDLTHCQLVLATEHGDDVTSSGLDIRSKDMIDAALNENGLYLGPPNAAASHLLTVPTKSIAIIRLPDRLPAPVSRCVLILGGQTENSFQPDLGSDLLVLLAEMVGVTLAARLEAEGAG